MPASNPSPPADANGNTGVRGLVNGIAQTFAGVKTFTSALIASAGIQVASLFNTNGTGSTDVGVKVGVSQPDGSVNAGAKLLSVRTGLNGGTEVEKLWVLKDGSLSGVYGGNGVLLRGAVTISDGFGFVSTVTGALLVSNWARFASGVQDASGNLVANFHAGRHDAWGTDSTLSPGNATINKASGKSAIAIGAATVRITNSLVTAASRVHITPHARDATCKELIAVPSAGFFDVSGTANATAALPFSWEVSNIL